MTGTSPRQIPVHIYMSLANKYPCILVTNSLPVRHLSTKKKKKKRLAHELLDTFATHADLVDDVTDTDCPTQNGDALGRVFWRLSNVEFYQTRPKIDFFF